VPTEVSNQLNDQGYAGPVPVLSAEECRRFVSALSDPRLRPPLDWTKGFGATSRAHYEIATHPGVVALVQDVLGRDIILFSACDLTQPPGASHPWHSDIETSGPVGRTVSVWIGLENVGADSSLHFISYSHRFGATLQEVRGSIGKGRRDATTEDVLAWARKINPSAAHATPTAGVGQALLFQGQVWHYSHNRSTKPRRSLLLQYATPDTPVRIPDPNHLEWPFRHRQHPLPPCIMIRGSDDGGVNRIVPAPPRASRVAKYQLTDQVFAPSLPLPADEQTGFKYYKMFSGATADVREMEVHVSALKHGQSPHPPHTHREEELLIMLAGDADLILPAVKGAHADERFPLKAGEFVYYPAHFPHTLRTTSDGPANYLMFKWDTDERSAGAIATNAPLGFLHHRTCDVDASGNGNGDPRPRTRFLFDGPTGCLRSLHCHISVLAPGGGYAPHADAYDVAIVVLEGELESLGQRLGPGGTLFHAAGYPHGLRNPSASHARYLVFEFHASQSARPEAFPGLDPKSEPSLLRKAADPQRWKRKLKRVASRLRSF
jgi:quercetin dioxygenase-like cupin family protein